MKGKNFGDYLRHVIQMQDLTQRQAAVLLHLSPQTLNNYIQNKRLPDMMTMIHILDTFHMDANRIFHLDPSQAEFSLTADEMALIRYFRSLDHAHRDFVMSMLQHLPKS